VHTQGVSIDIESLHTRAKRSLGAKAPGPMKTMAAKGAIPGVSPADCLSVVVILAARQELEEKEIAEIARQTLREPPLPFLEGALGGTLQRDVVAALADYTKLDGSLLPKLLAQETIDEEIVCVLAAKADEAGGEIIGTNESLLLRFPAAIEKLYMNKRVRMSTADRLIELAVRNEIELDFPAFKLAAKAIMSQLIPEPTDEPTFDDLHFQQTDEVAEKANLDSEEEDVCEKDDDGKETITKKAGPVFVQVQNASVTELIRFAMVGNATMRLLLVRHTNRLVSEAAAKSPRMTENEAGQIAASRAVSDTVLRIIANNREMVRSYKVKLNLVTNPLTPFTYVSRLMPHLRQVDLKLLARSKNVPGQVQKSAKNILSRRK